MNKKTHSSYLIAVILHISNRMHKKKSFIQRKRSGDVFDEKVVEDLQDLIDAPMLPRQQRSHAKLDAGVPCKRGTRTPETTSQIFCMLMFGCAYLQAAGVFMLCCRPHAALFNVPSCTQCSVAVMRFVFGCVRLKAALLATLMFVFGDCQEVHPVRQAETHLMGPTHW